MSKHAADTPWVPVGDLTDIPARGARRLAVGEHRLALFRTADNRVFALEDRCPHAGGPLSDGIVHDKCVTCPLHNWVISLEDGEAQGADEGRVRTFPIRVDGERVMLQLSDVSLSEPAHAEAV